MRWLVEFKKGIADIASDPVDTAGHKLATTQLAGLANMID